jgi:membrane-bound lytic murein transglycosylase D
MKLFLALFFATTLTVAAQPPQVPHKMQFANITLTIRDDARREIQKDVDAFTKYPNAFNLKVERAKTYFPIIEKIFAEEEVPDDFKYLVLQESSLVPDAVSVSNAVGFWQFKDFTAIEMGLRVDKEIDERMNIVSSSRAAARYIKKNNTFFNNWLYALQAYQMGAGGVLRSEKESKSGAEHLEITSNTYWYVKKYLAHKIAYEDAVKGEGKVKVIVYQNQSKKKLSELAKEVAVEEEALLAYNKWAKHGHIPDDRSYAVVIPVAGNASAIKLPESAVASASASVAPASMETATAKKAVKSKVNGIHVIAAQAGETPAQLAQRADVALASFLRWNDLSSEDKLEAGRYYFLGKKRPRAVEAYHKVSAGENLWTVSQQYGVQMKKLKKYNRISGDQDLKPGMTLFLSSMKPKNAPEKSLPASVVEVESESFTWTLTPSESKEGPLDKGAHQLKADTTRSLPSAKKEEIKSTPSATEVAIAKRDTLQAIQSQLPSLIPADTTTSSKTISVVVPPEKKNEHTVQAGETLYGIARQYNLAVMDLVKWNNLDLQQGIRPGQVIKLVDNQMIAEHVETSEPTIHEVKATDTVYSIARKYGVTIKELMDWNNKRDFNITVGEKLRILKK